MDSTSSYEYCIGNILLLSNKLQVWGDELTGDITFKQFFLMLLLSKIPTQKLTVQVIADYAGSSRQNVKKMLEQLREKGYVNIITSSSDARSLEITLTPNAYKYFQTNAEKSAMAVNTLFSEISGQELNTTIQTLEKLLASLCELPQ